MNILKYYAIKWGIIGSKSPITRAEFRDYCLGVFMSRTRGAKAVVVGDDSVDLTLNGKKQTVYFNNAYMLYLQSKGGLNDVVGKYVAGHIETLTHVEKHEKTSLLPVVKDKSYWQDVQKIGIKGDDGRVTVPVRFTLNDILDVYIVSDTEFNMRYVTVDQLDKYGVSHEDVLELAIANYDEKFGLPEIIGNDGEFILRVDGNYEASMILNKKVMEKIRRLVDGELVFSVPTRDLVLLTGSKNIKGIEKFSRICSDVIKESPYSLTGDLFLWKGDAIVAYQPENQRGDAPEPASPAR